MAVLYANINVLNLIRAATGSQCREIKKRSEVGPFGLMEDQSCILKHLLRFDDA